MIRLLGHKKVIETRFNMKDRWITTSNRYVRSSRTDTESLIRLFFLLNIGFLQTLEKITFVMICTQSNYWLYTWSRSFGFQVLFYALFLHRKWNWISNVIDNWFRISLFVMKRVNLYFIVFNYLYFIADIISFELQKKSC